MRVIAGQYRSRRLQSPPGVLTRPTSDRLRETLFNILGPRLGGCTFADLYAGTGAVGIEALSRGAHHVYFAENAVPALKSLRANVASLGITDRFTLEPRGTMPLLQRLHKSAIDLVYLDPPYEDEAAYTQTLGLLGNAILLAPHALVIAEHATKSRFPLPQRVGQLTQTRQYKQGEASLTFYALTQP